MKKFPNFLKNNDVSIHDSQYLEILQKIWKKLQFLNIKTDHTIYSEYFYFKLNKKLVYNKLSPEKIILYALIKIEEMKKKYSNKNFVLSFVKIYKINAYYIFFEKRLQNFLYLLVKIK